MHNMKNLITAIDSHTAGEGTRLITGGLPYIRGSTMAEKMAYARDHLAWLPGYILLEPRGHKDLYGAILVEPCNPEADWGVLFMNNQGYETMCGHGLIGVVTSLLETGMVSSEQSEAHLALDTPAGLVKARAKIQSSYVTEVTFDNVPAFVYQQDVWIKLAKGKTIQLDIVFGGNFFALVHTSQLGIELSIKNASRLSDLGMEILQIVNAQFSIQHPELPFIDQITDVRFYCEVEKEGINSRNMVVLGNHMIDRSPCGTGTCAELALRHARGELKDGETWVCESILGTCFSGQVAAQTIVGNLPQQFRAIVPRITGRAYITGWRLFTWCPDDPFPEGFIIP